MTIEKRSLGLLLLSFVLCVSLAFAQTEQQSLNEEPIISVVGRLVLEKHGQEECLALHAKDAQSYSIIGNLREQLKNSLIELGQNNLVSVAGNRAKRSRIYCERSYQYVDAKKGGKELKIDTKCIPYYNLEVSQILFTKQSDEEIPPPERDAQVERMAMANAKFQGQSQIPAVTGEIYGKITSVNLKSPIKTIEIANRDKEDPLKNIILILSSDTRIVKKIDEQEPMALSEKALMPGQEVAAQYMRDELKTEALFITITKE